jgi:hypothetical protein
MHGTVAGGLSANGGTPRAERERTGVRRRRVTSPSTHIQSKCGTTRFCFSFSSTHIFYLKTRNGLHSRCFACGMREEGRIRVSTSLSLSLALSLSFSLSLSSLLLVLSLSTCARDMAVLSFSLNFSLSLSLSLSTRTTQHEHGAFPSKDT